MYLSLPGGWALPFHACSGGGRPPGTQAPTPSVVDGCVVFTPRLKVCLLCLFRKLFILILDFQILLPEGGINKNLGTSTCPWVWVRALLPDLVSESASGCWLPGPHMVPLWMP